MSQLYNYFPASGHTWGLLTCWDTVLQRSFVEDVRREGAECRVHAILHLQADGSDAEHDESLEEWLWQSGPRRLLAHDHRPELAVVTHEHELTTAEHHGDHALGLRRLRALVDEHRAILQLGETRVAGADARTADDVCVLRYTKTRSTHIRTFEIQGYSRLFKAISKRNSRLF